MTVTEVETEKKILPEVKRYLDAYEETRKSVSELREKADNLYYERHTSAEAYDAYEKAKKAYETARDAQWERYEKLAEKLAAETEDKLIKFIVAEWLNDYRDQAVVVLKALPATLDELDAIAHEHDWCHVWGDAVESAVNAGAIELPKAEVLKRKLRRYLGRELYSDELRTAMKMIDELVQFRVEEATRTHVSDRIDAALSASAGIE